MSFSPPKKMTYTDAQTFSFAERRDLAHIMDADDCPSDASEYGSTASDQTTLAPTRTADQRKKMAAAVRGALRGGGTVLKGMKENYGVDVDDDEDWEDVRLSEAEESDGGKDVPGTFPREGAQVDGGAEGRNNDEVKCDRVYGGLKKGEKARKEKEAQEEKARKEKERKEKAEADEKKARELKDAPDLLRIDPLPRCQPERQIAYERLVLTLRVQYANKTPKPTHDELIKLIEVLAKDVHHDCEAHIPGFTRNGTYICFDATPKPWRRRVVMLYENEWMLWLLAEAKLGEGESVGIGMKGDVFPKSEYPRWEAKYGKSYGH